MKPLDVLNWRLKFKSIAGRLLWINGIVTSRAICDKFIFILVVVSQTCCASIKIKLTPAPSGKIHLLSSAHVFD